MRQKDAFAFVAEHHRHHKPPPCDIFRLGCEKDGKLVGVVIVARPVARRQDDGKTVEVSRLCTDGSKNVCSFLYSRAARIAQIMGYERIITYILDTEDGASCKASGFIFDGMTEAKSWNVPSRPRVDKHPVCPKKRFVKWL